MSAPPIYAELVAEQGDALAVAAETSDRIEALAAEIAEAFGQLGDHDSGD